MSPIDACAFIDLHVHAGPDLSRRRASIVETAREYEAVCGWMVIKSHLGSTVRAAHRLRSLGLPVSGCVTLNRISGGADARRIDSAAAEEGPDADERTIVYLPTVAERALREHRGRRLERDASSPGSIHVATLDQIASRGGLEEIVRAVGDNDLILASGHLSRSDALRVVDCAVARGDVRVLLTHVTSPWIGFTAADLADLAGVSAVTLEVTWLTGQLYPETLPLARDILASAANAVMSSDIGQVGSPDTASWLAASHKLLAGFGLSEERIDCVTRRTAHRLLRRP